MTEQKLDDGYRAVAFEVGDSLESALARIRELEGQSERRRSLLETSDARVNRLSACIEELEAQLAEYKETLATLGIQRDVLGYISGMKTSYQMAIDAAEAQLAEAEKSLTEKEDGQLARYWMSRFDKAEAKFDTAIRQLTLANQVNRELASRAEAAEARAEAMRKALEEIAEGRFYCADGDCRAVETARAALAPTPVALDEDLASEPPDYAGCRCEDGGYCPVCDKELSDSAADADKGEE
jgi:chromosome segregation ATPase